MSNPSRESFNASKHYRRAVFIDERLVPDFSLNELQALQDAAREDLGNALYYPSAVLAGLTVVLPGSGQITLGDGKLWAYGRVEDVTGVTLAYDAAKVTGDDVVFVKWLMDQRTISDDPTLVHVPTGEAIDERLRTQVALAASSPDIFDEMFEQWVDAIPLNWDLISGVSAIGYPAKFGRQSLELRHTTGTETRIERDITVPVSAALSVYFWVRTQEDYTDLATSHGAYVDFDRSSPAWHPTDITFATSSGWVRKTATITADANTEQVRIRVVIPSTAPSTRVLIDGLLVTTTPLVTADVERHYLPVLIWDRATDIVTRSVPRSSRLPMSDLVPPLPGDDIEGIQRNRGLLGLLARRTYNENGHFRLPPGLRVKRDTLRDTLTQLGMIAMPGWAYVLGAECKIDVPQELFVSKALSVGSVSGENDAFVFGTNLYDLNKAAGSDLFPIEAISQLQITYEQVVTITKGSDGSVDDTGITSVSSVQGVSAGTAGALTGSVATTFTFAAASKTFTASVSPYAGGAVGSAQSIVFSVGAYTIAQVLEALNHGSGVAYRSGKIVGNVVFENDGSAHIRIRTKTLSNASTVTLGSGDANAALGFTNAATNTGTGVQYVETTAWVRSGNSVDWVALATQPSPGNSYSVVVRNTETLILNTDYRLGGAFVASAPYQYKVTAIVAGTEGLPSAASTAITTPIGGINRIAWGAIGSTQSYGVYRSDDAGVTYNLVKYVDGTLLVYLDEGSVTPNAAIHPPGSGSAGPATIAVSAAAVGVINLFPVGKMPVDGSNLSADYTYYQPYMAYVVINDAAAISVIEGEPDDHPSPPALPEGVMELAQLEVGANSASITIQDVKKYDRVPQADLHTLVDRVNALEVGDLRQLVLNDLRNRGDGSTHKGRVAEGFADEIGTDFSYSDGGVTCTVGIHPALKFAGLPNTYAQPTLVVNSGNTTAIHRQEEYMLPSTENTLISQPLRSEYLQINPDAGVRIPTRTIELFPRSTNWAFRMNAAVTPQQRTARTNTLFAALWRKTVRRFLPPWNNDPEAIQQTAQHAIRKEIDTVYRFETEPVVVTVEGRAWGSATNLRGFFGGVAVDLTAVSPTTQGTAFGGKTTIHPISPLGYWKATFTVPAGTSAGADDLLVTNGTASARATFTSLAYGDLMPEPPLVETPLYDPIAQSVGPWPTDQTISAVELTFIATNPDDLIQPLYLQIRTMENGFPTRVALTTKVVDPATVNWNVLNSQISPSTWLSTKITLDRFLHVPKDTQVAITLLTASLNYRVAVAVRGHKDQSGRVIYNNPYGLGVLFISSNGATWESRQDADFNMIVYGQTFSASAVLEFNSVAPSGVSRLWLAADQSVPEGTAVKWEYTLNAGATYPISPFTKVRPPAIPTGIVLRARLSRTSTGVTPRVTLPTLALIGEQRTSPGTWISTAVVFTQTLTNALMTATAHIPSGATVTWYVSRDDGAVWTAMGTPTDIVDQDVYWKDYQWNTPVALGGSAGIKKLRVRAELTIASHLNYGPTIAKVGVALT